MKFTNLTLTLLLSMSCQMPQYILYETDSTSLDTMTSEDGYTIDGSEAEVVEDVVPDTTDIIDVSPDAQQNPRPIELALGSQFSCLLISNGTVKCWGANAVGQLGDGTVASRPSPALVNGISTATKIAAGTTHMCAILQDQSLRCWGRNGSGELGDGSRIQRSVPVQVLSSLNPPTALQGRVGCCAWGRSLMCCDAQQHYSMLGKQ